MKKKNFRFEPKQTETRSVSRLFRFVSWNPKKNFSVCFGVSNLYRNNRNKQNSFETNRNNPELSKKYQHFERFGGSCHSFYLFCLFHTFIITFIQYIHSFISIRRGTSPFLHCLLAQREKPPRGAEPRFELGPAIQLASALPTQPRFIWTKKVFS